MTAIARAYASNEATPILTIELTHPALSGGVLRLVRAKTDLIATLEDSSEVTFTKSGISLNLPAENTNGRQDLGIQIDNVSNVVYEQIKLVVAANRSTANRVVCKYRAYMEEDLSAPAGEIYTFTIISTSVNRISASLRASYAPIPDTTYPRYRYYPTLYPGIKYA